MPKYLCSYCDTHLNFDSQSGRKQHNRGRKHQENVRGYYAQYAAALVTAARTAASGGTYQPGGPINTTGAPGSGPMSITILPSHAPSNPQRPPMPHGSSQPFAPYAPPYQPYSVRSMPPPPMAGGYNAPSSYPPPPPHHQQASFQMPPPPPGRYPPPGGEVGGSVALPPPPPGSVLPPPPPTNAAAASATTPAAEAPKTFINPDRMRALGLQGHH